MRIHTCNIHLFLIRKMTSDLQCRYTLEQQEALVSNVFLTGGNMQYPGMKERVERELLAMRPFQSHFKVQCPTSVLNHVSDYTQLTNIITALTLLGPRQSCAEVFK